MFRKYRVLIIFSIRPGLIEQSLGFQESLYIFRLLWETGLSEEWVT